MAKQARGHRISIMLNDSELRALERFCDKYGVANRSRLVREALMRAVEGLPDLVLAANGARAASESLGRLAGKVYADDLLDSLFSRFCIGK